MYGLQFFGQVTVRCVRILDRIVRKRRAAAKRFYQIPSCIRVSLTGIIVFLKKFSSSVAVYKQYAFRLWNMFFDFLNCFFSYFLKIS